MSKGSDNPYPSVLVVEGTVPASPASGNQRLYIDSADHLPKRVNSGGTVTALSAMVKIAESVLGSSAASVSFTSIPASYRSLELYILSRCDNAVTQNNLNIQFNGDTGANYEWEDGFFSANNSGSAGNLTDTKIGLGWSTGASATANKAAQSKVTIFQYAGTTFYKNVNAIAGLDRGTASTDQFTWQSSGLWLSTAAITSILVFPAAGNFIPGSVFSLYGIA